MLLLEFACREAALAVVGEISEGMADDNEGSNERGI